MTTTDRRTEQSMRSATSALHLFIPGQPKPAGSKNAIPIFKDGKALMKTSKRGHQVPVIAVADQAKNKPWIATIKTFAAANWQDKPIEVPCMLVLTFMVRRPNAHFKGSRNFGVLKPDAPLRPAKRPDLLKLARCVEDALTGIVYADDSLIVDEHLHKRWTEDESEFGREGVFVTVAMV